MVENFRPDVKDRLGIGYEALRAVNPRIILASISGFGQTGPYRMRAGFDQIAQGMGGLMWVTGMPGEGPMRAGIAVADSSAGVYAATGILMALAERERSGVGQWVQTSLLQAQIAMLDFQAARYLVDGVVPGQAGNDHPYSTPMGVVADRRRLHQYRRRRRRPVAGLMQARWSGPTSAADRIMQRSDMRFRNRPELIAAAGRDFQDQAPRPIGSNGWSSNGVPAGPIYKIDEVFADPQVRASRHRRAAASPGPRRRPHRRPADHAVAHAARK